ncbi:alkaline phosphatase [Falsibacillus pallidus]|uniref:Alkaline phosphatase n=1 Tax=Falsibacillus pallidus TaxID=493781 RepID=A0A370GEF9_9BACI|nr:alkaline phosphatase [Falsibacillus pallidus]RDI41640.1 alkaline phosphatase [Falsibacillus pallidus]
MGVSRGKFFLVIFSISILTAGCQASPGAEAKQPGKRNVIFMVMDGTNSDVVTLARWYKGGSLNLDKILTGGVRTYSLESSITDSAAAGTALATGHKTVTDAIGMVPVDSEGRSEKQRRSFRPVVNVLEAAQAEGLATGIVSTSPVQHATPAAFSSHSIARDDFDDIGEQQVYQGMDVVLGGGKLSLIPKSELDDGNLEKVPFGAKDARKDGENLVSVIRDKGYSFVETKRQMERASGSKLWGSFAYGDVAYEFDRAKLHPNQPSLAEMTGKAIDVLSKDRDGFFLFVEGSKVDWAAHKNDPIGMISEVLSFDEAVGEALDFAKKDGNTMVVAVTDHGNSGLTIGGRTTNKTYAHTPIEKIVGPLKKAELTVEGAVSELKEDRSNLKSVLADYGLDGLSVDDFSMVASSKDVGGEMVKLLAEHANLGFTTHGHTGEDVFLYSYGPGKPTGLVNNIEISKYIADFIGMDMKGVGSKLFVNAAEYYKAEGFDVSVDDSDAENPVFVAKKDSLVIQYPENKNVRIENGKATELSGVNVFNGEEFFIPVE